MNLAERLLAELDRNQRRVVVVGDAMIDRWVNGHLETSQDGCHKFVQEEVVETHGGAANAARCLSNWPTEVKLAATSRYRWCVKTRFVDKGKIVFRYDRDFTTKLKSASRLAEVLDVIKGADAVLLSDYDKGFLTPKIIGAVSTACRDRGIPCVADCKRGPEVYEGCILKGNDEWSKQYHQVWGMSDVVITQGWCLPFVDADHIPSCSVLSSVDCVNHVGAGDCFAAHLTLALSCEFSLKEAAALAHSTGRIYVQYPYNRPPMPAEVAADLALAASSISA